LLHAKAKKLANKKGKYEITFKTSLTADELFKKAITTPINKPESKYKPQQKP
jgi:hypothetical protein